MRDLKNILAEQAHQKGSPLPGHKAEVSKERRERIAIAALTGAMTGPSVNRIVAAEYAVRAADALIKRLDAELE